jgi:hypothetical protein
VLASSIVGDHHAGTGAVSLERRARVPPETEFPDAFADFEKVDVAGIT